MDAATLAQLLDQHAAALELYAAQWAPTPEDCVQEAFVELAQQRQAPKNPAAWLYRVVRNRALNAARAQRRRVGYEQIAARLRSEQQAGATHQESTVAEALAELEEESREIVMLRLWSGLTWREIAEVSGVPASSAQRCYAEALLQLQKLFEVKV
ncbi:RNA polymerase sigma factor [Adhaeretor mobilis]|uniref:ECF RNA polymerase sigma factor SigR n=1 Tax=Adhaeretor mobilis TaxID=1930276 RepID=A0A517MPI4_9BACT|nr:RNA polymerase sigma factor [Adhaeretor mobilis]QDS96806.1 ECF RNA polymerase sigma factor SigR [Adhaeretor mobilis]